MDCLSSGNLKEEKHHHSTVSLHLSGPLQRVVSRPHRADLAPQVLAPRVLLAGSKHKGRSLLGNPPVRRLRQLPVGAGDKARPRSHCTLCGAKRAY
jgi:hypothetical protein